MRGAVSKNRVKQPLKEVLVKPTNVTIVNVLVQ